MLHFQFRMTCRLVAFKIFYFHPYLGKISNMTNIFPMGWFNHQPAWDDLGFFEEIPQNRPASKRSFKNEPRGHEMLIRCVFHSWLACCPSLNLESWLIQKYFQNMKLNLIYYITRFNHYDDNNNTSLVLVDPLGPSSLRSHHFDLNKNPPWSSAFRCRTG